MRKALSSFVLFFFISNTVMADCDWTTIKRNQDNTFTYSEELHLCVGKLVQDNAVKDSQIKDLNKAIELKDLALKASDDRVNLWMNTSFKLENNLTKVQGLQTGNNALWFGLGVAATVLSVFVTAKALGH